MAEGDPSLKVPIHTVRVEVAFPSEGPRALELFAPAGDVPRPPRARLAELLERDQRFLPARDVETGQVVTLGSRSMLWISVSLTATAEPLADDDLFEHRRDVRVELTDGSRLEGELLYSAPATSTRVVDVLNAASRFLPLWLSDRVVFLNKSFVRRVSEIAHVHRPPVATAPVARKKRSR